MKKTQWFFLLVLFFSPFFLFAQIPLKGDLILGDTTQVHILTATNGDTFTGRVVGFDQENLLFQYQGNQLVFPVAEVTLVEVAVKVGEKEKMAGMPFEKKQPILDASLFFMYRAVTKNGAVYEGLLKKINAKEAVLDRPANDLLLLEFDSIILVGKKITEAAGRPNKFHRLKTKAGDSFVGQLLSFSGGEYVFLMRNGSELRFTVREVSHIHLEKEGEGPFIRSGSLGNYQHNQQRVFFSPSAFLLEEGTKEFRTMIVQNTIDFGVSKNITIGTGVYTVIVASGITGKIKIGGSFSDHFHVAVGAQGMYAFSVFDDAIGMGLVYGAVSIGTREKFISIGAGRGGDTEVDEGTTGYILNGSYRIGKKWRFFMEYLNFQQDDSDYPYYQPDNTTMGTLGLSWFKNRHQVDFGLFTTSSYDFDSTTVPAVGYSLRF